jgi:hypothetical protein
MQETDHEMDYTVETDHIEKNEWNHVIRDFDDLSIYQTWSWGKLSSGESRLSHMVVKQNGFPVSIAQVRISSIPFLGWGMASVAWGPLWIKRDSPPDYGILRRSLRALREEYVEKRKLLVMVKPSITSWFTDDLDGVYEEEGFQASSLRDPYHTIVMDLSPSLDSLRQGMKRQWRQKLNQAEKNNLDVESGTGDELLDAIEGLYRQMLARKQFTNIADLQFYSSLQHDLDEQHKLQILICRYRGEPTAGLVFSPLGRTSVALVAATGDNGLELNGSFLLWWKAIEYLRERGHQRLDLCGIDPQKNPGGYQFKTGLCGKWGCEVLAREYQCCGCMMSSATSRFGHLAQCLGRKLRKHIVLKQMEKEKNARSIT